MSGGRLNHCNIRSRQVRARIFAFEAKISSIALRLRVVTHARKAFITETVKHCLKRTNTTRFRMHVHASECELSSEYVKRPNTMHMDRIWHVSECEVS